VSAWPSERSRKQTSRTSAWTVPSTAACTYWAGVVIYAIPKTDKDEFFQIVAETRHQVKELPNSQPLMRLSFQLTRGTLLCTR
jgi:hypothetical protein